MASPTQETGSEREKEGGGVRGSCSRIPAPFLRESHIHYYIADPVLPCLILANPASRKHSNPESSTVFSEIPDPENTLPDLE